MKIVVFGDQQRVGALQETEAIVGLHRHGRVKRRSTRRSAIEPVVAAETAAGPDDDIGERIKDATAKPLNRRRVVALGMH